MGNMQMEETVLTDDIKAILDEAAKKYYETNTQNKSLEATKGVYNKMLKELFEEYGLKKYVASDGTKVSITTTNKPVFNEEKLLEYIKSTGVEGIVKTKEYVDMEALENAIYHGTINASTLAPFKEDKITTTLRCSKPEVLKEG
jgi:phage host-nuclease inhibitor protein Gam